MRIAQVTATFPPYYGGAGAVCYYTSLGLAGLGHQVTVITANHPPGEYPYPGEITVRRLPVLFRLGNAPLLPGLLRLDGFDIIHLHHPFIFGAEEVWALSRLRGMPYVITHHNDLIGRGLRRYLFDTYSALCTRTVFGGARKLGVVSLDHASFSRLEPLFRERWADVVEMPNGVDTERFHPDIDGRPVRNQYGIPENAKVLLFVGTLDRAHHYRRVDLLLEAAGAIQDPELHLLLVGSGDRASFYRNLAEQLGLGGRTHFLGSQDHQTLPGIYAAADVMVLPSQLQEAFPLVLLEAMACGKPVIASNLPGVRSMVDDGKDGLLVRPADVADLAEKIQMLLDDPERRREMGERGRAKVESKYAWPQIVSRLVQFYEGALSTNGGES